jgi:sulfite exporter TauE/SafE
MVTTTLLAAFVAGLAGSAHCFGMCGGMAGALGMRARAGATSNQAAHVRSLLYHVGRILGYATVGAIGGALGHSAHWALAFTRFESALRVTAGALMLLVAVRVLTRWNAFAPIESAGAKLWGKLRPLSSRAATNDHWSGSLATGLLWGFLPCGLVYSMVLLTLTTRSAIEGASVMLAFGLGTLPVMASMTMVLGASWPKLSQRPWFRGAMGAALIVFGMWMIFAAQGAHEHEGHTHELRAETS